METAILSAAVALIIFTFSQIIIHLRDRQALLRSKLEDLFSALNEISNSLTDTYYGAQILEERGNIEELNKQMISINKALYRPRTLILLYFPYLTTAWEDLFVTPLRAYFNYCNAANKDHHNFSSDECEKQINVLSLKIRQFQNFLSRNTALTTESIGFHMKRLISGKVKIKI